MNAGRDVERLIAGWLVDEAAVRAPDRVLESAHRTIDRTLQRRWLAAWREPVTVTTTKLAALAAALIVALAGAAWIGRTTAPGVGGPVGSPEPTPTPQVTTAAATLDSYKAARGEICVRYRSLINPLNSEVRNIFDPNLPAADRADKTVALAAIAERIEALAGELAAVDVPPELAAEHQANVAKYQATVALIRSSVAKLDEGDLAGAEARDLATNELSQDIRAFETKYRLLVCP